MPPKRKKMCFVIMPFREELQRVYTDAIKPACEQAGFKVVRVDEVKGPFNITRTIIKYLYESDVVVADLTDHNPNVFYEMGVAHAIANKTIMIVEKTEKLPFDIQSYNCIFYRKTVKGFENLGKELIDSLESLDEWRTSPCNPVQEFKPADAAPSQDDLRKLPKALADLEALRTKLKTAEAKLNQSVPKQQLQAARNQVREQEKKLSALADLHDAKAQRDQLANEVARLQHQIKQLRSQRPQPAQALESATVSKQPTLSSKPAKLSETAAKKMLKDKGFFATDWNKAATGLKHSYEVAGNDGEKVVTGGTTGLMWQQSGSSGEVDFKDAEEYIQELNKGKHAGFSDWRLPTLEEAMSLMEPNKNEASLYIDPAFDSKQSWIWTADKYSVGSAWLVHFDDGYCYHHPVDSTRYVRAVR